MKFQPVVASIIIVLGGALGNFLRFTEVMPGQAAKFGKIPINLNGYTGEEQRFSEISYERLQADTSTLRRYLSPSGRELWLFVAYFSSQKYGSQIHSPKHCLPGGGWQIQLLEPYNLKTTGNQIKEVNRVLIAQQDQRQLMFYWFETRGGSIRSEFTLKWDLMINSMLLRPTDAAFIRLTIDLERGEDIAEATSHAIDYFNIYFGAIEDALPFASVNTSSGNAAP